MANLAVLLAVAIITLAVSGDREAGKRRDRSVDDAEYLAEGDHVGRLQQQVSTRLAAATDDDTLMLEVKKDLFEELLRDFLLRRNVGNHHRLAVIGCRQYCQRP